MAMDWTWAKNFDVDALSTIVEDESCVNKSDVYSFGAYICRQEKMEHGPKEAKPSCRMSRGKSEHVEAETLRLALRSLVRGCADTVSVVVGIRLLGLLLGL